jgi:crotonobetainyl-CoA:carnitine CoA-transferase CaiB-like acyl-CoA transferase
VANGETTSAGRGALSGVRVIEIGGQLVEYCGQILAGLGADVIKVEPPGGNPTRDIGPFLDDVQGRERSLYFWAYNRAKRSVVIDLETDEGRGELARLLDTADVLLDDRLPREFSYLADEPGQDLAARFPLLVRARMTPFGDEGPWRDYAGSDLVHLALGGVLMNCGYDPDPRGHYDVAPMAPQPFHATHIAGEHLAFSILAALVHRERSGVGQVVSCAVHEAVSKSTETDLMAWVMLRQPYFRQTGRHSAAAVGEDWTMVHTKDGRWINTLSIGSRDRRQLVPFLHRYGMGLSLEVEDAKDDVGLRQVPGTTRGASSNVEHIQRFARRFVYAEIPWEEAQEAGLLWSPVRKPHENALDEHWLSRGTFTDVEHPEVGRTFRYPISKWLSTAPGWIAGRRAPLIGEDRDSLAEDLAGKTPTVRVTVRESLSPTCPSGLKSALGDPFALDHIRIFDFTWFLASAGGTRFLASFGADVIKVEWKGNPDSRGGVYPVGGRDARRRATSPLKSIPPDPDMGGQFNNKNPGKRGISLNVRHPKGLEMAREMIRQCDIVAEGFSPGVMERWGLGWDVLRSLNPHIIYAQQSGMGSSGRYGRFRAVGPIAGALAGMAEMGGLPEPAPPSGWGYSYLDWIGAYSFALAMLTAIFHRERTGEGQFIDASQTETGIALAALPILDWSANGRTFQRSGNRSPYIAAAPHGVYPCAGEDHWVAITCFEEAQWQALVKVSGRTEWLEDPRFVSMEARVAHQDALDDEMARWTVGRERYELMHELQRRGVPAGVAQTAGDRCDHDPQLAALEWLTEVTGTKIGTWPVAEVPVNMSRTPPYAGGRIDRGAPCYGEHNYDVYAELLGLSRPEVDALAEEGVI